MHNLPFEHQHLKLLQTPHPPSLVRSMAQILTRLVESLCTEPSPSDLYMALITKPPPVSPNLSSNPWLGETSSPAPMTKIERIRIFYQVTLTYPAATEGHPIA